MTFGVSCMGFPFRASPSYVGIGALARSSRGGALSSAPAANQSASRSSRARGRRRSSPRRSSAGGRAGQTARADVRRRAGHGGEGGAGAIQHQDAAARPQRRQRMPGAHRRSRAQPVRRHRPAAAPPPARRATRAEEPGRAEAARRARGPKAAARRAARPAAAPRAASAAARTTTAGADRRGPAAGAASLPHSPLTRPACMQSLEHAGRVRDKRARGIAHRGRGWLSGVGMSERRRRTRWRCRGAAGSRGGAPGRACRATRPPAAAAPDEAAEHLPGRGRGHRRPAGRPSRGCARWCGPNRSRPREQADEPDAAASRGGVAHGSGHRPRRRLQPPIGCKDGEEAARPRLVGQIEDKVN